MGNLPEEVIEEILSRLPVESLLRFKCVCKSWFALFRNPKFVSKHTSNQSKDNVFLRRSCPDKGNVFYLVSRFDDVDNDGCCVKDFSFNLNSEFTEDNDDDQYQFELLAMHGHCNGIVALSDFDREVILWNPAIREFRILSESCFHWFSQSGETITNGVGFGYDPKTDDYKVVRVVSFPGLTRPIRFSKAEVFSLRGNSTWREINNADMGASLLRDDDLEQFFNGVYYWRAQDVITDERVLVSFDMAAEVFSRAPMPDFCSFNLWGSKTLVTCLGVFNNESIALFAHPYHKFGTCIDVWVMKEFGLKESWTKQLTIGPLRLLERVLVFWKNDKELLQEDVSGRLVFYNLATRGLRNLSIHGAVFPFMAQSKLQTAGQRLPTRRP